MSKPIDGIGIEKGGMKMSQGYGHFLYPLNPPLRLDLVSKRIDGIGIERAIQAEPKASQASEKGTRGGESTLGKARQVCSLLRNANRNTNTIRNKT